MLLRHAKSDWSLGLPDFNRPLKPRGVKAAQKVGSYLAQISWRPDCLFSSPARRALDTAQLCASNMAWSLARIQTDPRLYLAEPEDFVQVMTALLEPEDHKVLLVGHNPGLEALLYQLVENPPDETDDGKVLTTAALALIELPDNWARNFHHSGRLLKLLRPAQLP